MIAASEPQVFVPYGREQLKNHLGDVVLQPNDIQVQSESFLVHQLSQIAIDLNQREWWKLRVKDGVEEELYVRGKTAIFSRGNKENVRDTVASYTVQTDISFALWCDFLLSDNNKPVDNDRITVPSVCLLDDSKINVFTEDGEDFMSALEFKVTGAWNTKYGLLIERVLRQPSQMHTIKDMSTPHGDNSSASKLDGSGLATMFSLLHPLDEMAPLLVMKPGSGGVYYMCEPSMKVVFTSSEPSLCMLYDFKTGLHSLWKIRKTTTEECLFTCGQENSLSASITQSHFLSNTHTYLSDLKSGDSIKNSGMWSGNKSMWKSHFSSPMLGSRHNSTSSNSPFGMGNVPASALKGQSPHMSLRQQLYGASPSRKDILMQAHVVLTPASPVESRLGISQCVSELEPKAIVPAVCLEYMWTENQGTPREEKLGPATKVFYSTDLVGLKYLSYLVPTKELLFCARLEKTNDKEPGVIVGTVNCVSAKDAAFLPALHLIVVLEPSGSIMLYSGTAPVGKLHIPVFFSAPEMPPPLFNPTATPADVSHNNIVPAPGSPSLSSRRSLLSSTRLGDGLFGETDVALSPVLTQHKLPSQSLSTATTLEAKHCPSPVLRSNLIRAFGDSISSKFIVEYESGTYAKISLPEVCSSPLVRESLNALKCCLPRDMALQLCVRCYAARNAPGTQDITAIQDWQIFINCLLELLGYDVEKIPISEFFLSAGLESPVILPKKKRPSNSGNHEDWEYLLSSQHHHMMYPELYNLLNLNSDVEPRTASPPSHGPPAAARINTAAPLFSSAYFVLFGLHLLYEELKLSTLMCDSLPMLAQLLHQLASDLCMKEYVHHYWRDHPSVCSSTLGKESQVTQSDLDKLTVPQFLPNTPPSIFKHLYWLLKRFEPPVYPSVPNVNNLSRNVIQIVSNFVNGCDNLDRLVKVIQPSGYHVGPETSEKAIYRRLAQDPSLTVAQKTTLLIAKLGLTRREIQTLPAGVNIVLIDALHQSRENPPTDWPEEAYHLIVRQDLAALCSNDSNTYALGSLRRNPSVNANDGDKNSLSTSVTRTNESDLDDGMDGIDLEILKLRWSRDHRISEVRRLLESSHPVTISITQRPEVSDHEFIEEQERHLYALSTRTMALPLARGMFTLHTASPVITEPLSIPPLCLTGKASPRETTIELSHIEVVPNMNLWPLFHNGAAAGLKISPNAANIDSTWILYNKPKQGPEAEHAGFLMALGLNGHLTNFEALTAYDYLFRCQEMTSVGVLLGLSASHIGTMNVKATKMLSIHLESLLPPTSVELEVLQNVQVAALLGMGLVYQGTAHRHVAEVLLNEIGKPPGPEMENSVDRESYSLAAGLGLGMVVLGQGNHLSGMNDLAIPDALHYYMVGGHKRPITGTQKDKYKSPSYQIREGDSVNINVTSPGATLALGMMYFNTGNEAVANWMKAPDTQYVLDFVCPDFLLLRVVARGLVMWSDILPTKKWVEDHVPSSIRPYCLVKPQANMINSNIDFETMNQAYCNIIAGACMAIGLRFAGSANNEAFETLHEYCLMFTSLTGKSIAELAGKSTIETCLNVILLSLALVMAGTGELEVLRLVRYLRSRVGGPSNTVVTYGSHLATHMALGLLFLGGGRYSISTSPAAIAALLCAFYPKFPTHSNDNRYHLQAFRHLYSLAVEPRLLLPRDIDSSNLCYVHLTVIFLDTKYYQNQFVKMKAPCILPELKLIKEVRVDDSRYWKITFKRGKNWHHLENILKKSSCLDIKQRAGCLSYAEDPHGFRSLLAFSLTTDKAISWSVAAESIFGFSSEPSIIKMAQCFLEQIECSSRKELQLTQLLTKVVYECIIHDKLAVLPLWFEVIRALNNLLEAPSTFSCWQLKLFLALSLNKHNIKSSEEIPVISMDMALSVKQTINYVMSSWESNYQITVKQCLMELDCDSQSKLQLIRAAYLTLLDFPSPDLLKEAVSKNLDPISLSKQLREYRIPMSSINKIGMD
ncbi:unnamed protein product [Bemisia tabaci]|uniref:Anaphase-promoting complex subunit 1 n=1 Tax=Bemisia tabaci TaxID=7038 RepID=A0A9P0AC52_BEMTA|nr:unnamed protein product [Bemisia tabaci]